MIPATRSSASYLQEKEAQNGGWRRAIRHGDALPDGSGINGESVHPIRSPLPLTV